MLNNNVKQNYTILDLPKRLKIARNHGVLGNYIESLKDYKVSLSIIQDRLKNISEPFLIEKWKILEAEVKSEMSQCSVLLELCNNFKTKPIDLKSINNEENKKNVIETKKSDLEIDNIASKNNINNNKLNNNFEPVNYVVSKQIKNSNKQDNNNNNNNIINNSNVIVNNKDYKINNRNIKNNYKYNKEELFNKNIVSESKEDNNVNITFENNLDDVNSNKLENKINQCDYNEKNDCISIKKNNNELDSLLNSFFKKDKKDIFNKDNSSDFNNNYYNKNNVKKKSEDDKYKFFNEESHIDIKKQIDYNDRPINTYENNDNYNNRDPFKNNMNQFYDYNNYNNQQNINKNVHVSSNRNQYNNLKKPIQSNNKNIRKQISNINNNKHKQSSKEEKSSYLKFKYPDGDGPDSHLISQIEEEVVDKNPNVQFEDVADLEGAKRTLKEAVIIPLLMPNFFKGIRRPWKGVLLYGPPGTGKTMLAKALATQGKTTFFSAHASTFASKWRGESEKLIRLLFDMAKFYSPTTIFIDEVDCIGSKRNSDEDEATRRSKTEFLIHMDGCNSESSSNSKEVSSSKKDNNMHEKKDNESRLIMVLGATNRPWDLDEALIRRFEKRIYIPLPSEKGREDLFKINLKNVEVDEHIDFKKLVMLTKDYSGADIANVCRDAAMMGIRRRLLNNQVDIANLVKETGFKKDINLPISEKDFIDAINNTKKSVSNLDLKRYEEWTNNFKSV